MTLLDQLAEFYYEHEWWHKEKLGRLDLFAYHEKLLNLGNIITVSDGDVLCGYVEYWRLTFEQFGRVVCDEPFSAFNEDVQTGYIAYVANTFIRPEYRQTSVYRQLRDRFFEINSPCTYFVGTARRKKSEPVKVFKRADIPKFKEVLNG